MSAMIQNDEEKEWMLPLMALRDKLATKDARHLRDFRRMHGGVQIFHERPIPGPYKQESRETWLRELLTAQTWIRKNGPPSVSGMELITSEELREIRRIWVVEKHEIEDTLPAIYKECTGEQYADDDLDERKTFGREELDLLREVCGDDPLHFELARNLLDTELRFRTKARRAGLHAAIEKEIRRCFYDDEDDAVDRALREHQARQLALIPEDDSPAGLEGEPS